MDGKEIVLQTKTHLVTIQSDMHIDITRMGRFIGDVFEEADGLDCPPIMSFDPQELADMLFAFVQSDAVSGPAKIGMSMMLAKSGLKPR